MIVIGAGISGLLAAKVLAGAGLSVCVLEKGRGVGGRMATRRRDGAIFDHGAQFFTVRDPRFRHWLDGWLADGLVEPWYTREDGQIRYRCVPGMSAVAKQLAEGIEVYRKALVQSFSLKNSRWKVVLEDGRSFTAHTLLCTAPVPQALKLLDAGNFLLPTKVRIELEAIQFHRCIAGLAILDRPSALKANGGSIKLTGEPIQWIADNYRKGTSPSVPSVTIHSTPAFAEAHWDAADSVRIPPLLEAAQSYLQAEVLHFHGHRWGFSQPINSFGREAYVDPIQRFAIAGDGMAGGRVEGAALSGLSAANEIVTALGGARNRLLQ